MIFLFPRWDMLVPWRVFIVLYMFQLPLDADPPMMLPFNLSAQGLGSVSGFGANGVSLKFNIST